MKNWYTLRVLPKSGRNALDMSNLYYALDIVESASPEFVMRGALTNDTYYPIQWNLNNTGQTGGTPDADIDAPELWNTPGGKGSSSEIIAIIDTGVDMDHEDLVPKLTSNGYDFVNNDPDPDDDNGHGTRVAGVAAAATNNAKGVAGVGWYPKIMPLKALTSGTVPIPRAVAHSIYRAVLIGGAKVINLSWGYIKNDTITSAIQWAYAWNRVIVAASGNWGHPVVRYPASLAETIAVGATNHNDHRWPFSNYGSALDVVAPGVHIWSTTPVEFDTTDGMQDGYTWDTGTSFAAPHVSGISAVLFSKNGSLGNEQVRQIIRESADDVGAPGPDEETGWGRVNAKQAFDMTPSGKPVAVLSHEVPGVFSLSQNYPNPFNLETMIRFRLPEASSVKLMIYNTPGQLVRTLVAERTMARGNHSVIWDGKSDEGQNVASGLYLYRLRAGDFVATRKMLLTR